jgi:glucokinase
MALLFSHDGRVYPLASEGGHADLAPVNAEQADLWSYLHERFGHVSCERVLCGAGLVNIYEWLRDSGRYREPAALARSLREADDPPRIVSERGLAGKSPLCRKALEHFVSIFGSIAGNLALTGMAIGGVYLGGGIPPKILPALRKGHFMDAFTRKGRMRSLLESIPVRVILNDKAALLGAAGCAFDRLEDD